MRTLWKRLGDQLAKNNCFDCNLQHILHGKASSIIFTRDPICRRKNPYAHSHRLFFTSSFIFPAEMRARKYSDKVQSFLPKVTSINRQITTGLWTKFYAWYTWNKSALGAIQFWWKKRPTRPEKMGHYPLPLYDRYSSFVRPRAKSQETNMTKVSEHRFDGASGWQSDICWTYLRRSTPEVGRHYTPTQCVRKGSTSDGEMEILR